MANPFLGAGSLACEPYLLVSELNPNMTLTQFQNGYWYAEQLKSFGHKIGIPSAKKLRKDELERAITHFLKTGVITKPTRRNLKKSGPKDTELGLHPDLPIVHYTSNKETKDFLLQEARKRAPGFKVKSGTRYLLNRWREDQITSGNPVTYGDLVQEMIRLTKETQGPLRIDHGRYNNFISDFMAAKAGTRNEAIRAWHDVKLMKGPKTYAHWLQHQA